jgi:hypothetical protein
MKDTLKVTGRIGAELGAAKAENEMLRELLRDVEFRGALTGWEPGLIGQITAALAQQAEPTETYTAVDMATAAAQAFRDGQAAVDPAAAQDERETVSHDAELYGIGFMVDGVRVSPDRVTIQYGRPAQTEQKPEQMNISPLLNAGAALSNIAFNLAQRQGVTLDQIVCDTLSSARKSWDAARADLSAKGAGKFRMGDLVKKSTGSEWEGHVCGWYSTNQTPEGYAVESEAHKGSVQIYPAKALEAVE